VGEADGDYFSRCHSCAPLNRRTVSVAGLTRRIDPARCAVRAEPDDTAGVHRTWTTAARVSPRRLHLSPPPYHRRDESLAALSIDPETLSFFGSSQGTMARVYRVPHRDQKDDPEQRHRHRGLCFARTRRAELAFDPSVGPCCRPRLRRLWQSEKPSSPQAVPPSPLLQGAFPRPAPP